MRIRLPSNLVPLVVLTLLLSAGVARAAEPAAPAAADPLGFEHEARPLLQQHCAGCHGTRKQKGGVNFAAMTDLPAILSRRDVWIKAREALEAEEMPPDPDDSDFTPEDRRRLVGWIRARVETIDRSSPVYRDPGPPLMRQLTRAEYNNTLRDLLKNDFDAASAGGIAAEDNVEGFGNLASAQVLDQRLLEKYFVAADAALAAVFDGDPKKNAKGKAARQALLGAAPAKDVPPREAARAVLGRFARRAFRRPAEPAEVDRLLSLFDRATKAGAGFEAAVRQAMMPALVSPSFLYRLEEDRSPPGSAEAYPVSDHELAVRLSYFLWSTMPDDELSALADAGTLSRPDTLDGQIKRMLADPRAKALTEQFGGQWLRLGRLRSALPSRDNFPTLTNSLKQAMQQEASRFFDNLRAEDRSVLDLLDADYTFVNEELARHYGLPGVAGPALRRVALRPEDHRGGLLGMGAILTLTSHTDRTKPTSRGKWVLDVILGTPPAPPPADAGNFKDRNDPKGKAAPKNFRQKLALHASDASCAACHKKIDPLGFALENYDAIGAWREQVGGQPVDNSGRLPGAGAFQGVEGLKRVLRARQDQFVRNLTAQVLTYALGRQVEYEDELAIAQIGEAMRADGYRFSALIRGVVTSRPFRFRRSEIEPPRARGEEKREERGFHGDP